MVDVLKWMCLATEYDELPVRHNEDLVNIELQKHLPMSADDWNLPMWDPHVKAFILLQAFMSRIELPIADYIMDLNSVLDQAIRIMQASIDVLTELGMLSSVKMMIRLMQTIKQARWPDDGPLAQLPGVDVARERHRMSQPDSFPADAERARDAFDIAAGHPGDFVDVGRETNQFLRAATSSLPNLALKIKLATSSKLTAEITRLNTAPNRDFRISAPLFPKSQTEGYFVIIGDEAKDEIYALKRVSWPSGRGGQPRANVTLELPPGLDCTDATCWVMSDGYIGIEQKLGVRLQDGMQVVGSWVEKETVPGRA